VRFARALALGLLVCSASGCAALGVIDDGTSVSWGKANHGGIVNPARLPDEGDGYRVPSRWADRGLRYGTDELVNLVVSVSRRVAMDWPDARVTVGDLSPQQGGASSWHRSHQSGRDVDLCFFVTDEAGRNYDPEVMRRFDASGASLPVEGEPRLLFDTARNWTLVRALLEHQGPPLQRIFVYVPLNELMLDHARAIGEPEWLIDLASIMLRQPADSAPHDDHMHVRISCTAEDAAFGCRDYGKLDSPIKKLAKAGMMAWASWATPVRRAVVEPRPAMLSLSGFPILR
jgi:penicillin-insensitive murein endopeptidase